MLYEIFFFNLIWYCNASFKKIHTNHSKVLWKRLHCTFSESSFSLS
jgi:hypothetical protein